MSFPSQPCDCAQAVLGLCRVATIHTDSTLRRPCWDCVVSLPFTLIGLCAGRAGTVSCRYHSH
uniref:Uncharacterized protein n=1 Tax=Timema tahoe TaxID=61484 RepID=A0A7R9FJ22_9NEOP|nr:unnamed protein product [Timema tahoe]